MKGIGRAELFWHTINDERCPFLSQTATAPVSPSSRYKRFCRLTPSRDRPKGLTRGQVVSNLPTRLPSLCILTINFFFLIVNRLCTVFSLFNTSQRTIFFTVNYVAVNCWLFVGTFHAASGNLVAWKQGAGILELPRESAIVRTKCRVNHYLPTVCLTTMQIVFILFNLGSCVAIASHLRKRDHSKGRQNIFL